MATGHTQRKTAKTSIRTKPVPALGDSKLLLETCNQIGALIVGQKHERIKQGVEVLQKQASAMLLQQHLGAWLPMFEQHFSALEQVLGKGLELSQANLMSELKTKAKAAGYPKMKDFLTQAVLPLVGYHGLLLHLNNNAGVALPAEVRGTVVQRMNAINKVLGGACAAMFMQESMGLS